MIVATQGELRTLPRFDDSAIVRIESPGRDDDVTRQLLRLGADETNSLTEWLDAPLPKGLLAEPGQWFRGFERVLQGLERSFAERPLLRPTASPADCAVLFDKTATAQRLHQQAIPVPNWLENPHDVFAVVPEEWPRAYLKLNTGSNAMGMIYLHSVDGVLEGDTTMAQIDQRYYNTRRLQRVRDEALHDRADYLLQQGAIAQQAIRMAQLDGLNFDLRVVCLHGSPIACIVRQSPYPMTNLHLGGQRGALEQCREAIPKRLWLDALDHCTAAAECFACAMVGVDLVFEQDYQRYFILEVNAFGDFFPGWVDEQGKSIHQREIEAIVQAL